MLFNSIGFAIFLPIVFMIYWFVVKKNLKFQNALLLVSSYFFYACWDYRFLFLLIFSTVLDYYTGIKMGEADDKPNIKKIWFWLSISINLGFLGVFKYYNFFADSFSEALSHIGITANFWTLKVILPVGISFYTFHGLSYVIDIYRSKIKPVTSLVEYAVFVSFFPLLVAGPIERATHLLPQIQKRRHFDYSKAQDGLRQILWGLFKKIVIADSCAEYADMTFNDSLNHSGSTLLLGAVFFAFQIYCDFSGYSDIALGTARLFGIELLRNFSFPYFSRDIAEFWRRWHISLSSWFRDYLYIPLGGSKGGTLRNVRNIFIIFLVSGFWHGANWTFIAWGALNAVYFLPLMLLNKNRENIEIVAEGKFLPSLKEFLQIGSTFFLTTMAWIFFRSANIEQALLYFNQIFSLSIFTFPFYSKTIFLICILLFVEWLQRDKKHALEGLKLPAAVRWSIYHLIVVLIFVFYKERTVFIYFQF